MRDPAELSEYTGYSFRDGSLLILALTHPSYSGEMQKTRIYSNQRLEFLGDAVLELVVSEYLYRRYPESEEGELTRMRSSLVFEPALFLCAKQICLPEFVLLGKGEEMSGGRDKPSVISDAFEAYTGALYLDGGFSAAREFIYEHVIGCVDAMELLNDNKSRLQEILQKRETPFRYDTTGCNDARGQFYCRLFVDGDEYSEGFGNSKKEAEQKAAGAAIDKIKEISQLCF